MDSSSRLSSCLCRTPAEALTQGPTARFLRASHLAACGQDAPLGDLMLVRAPRSSLTHLGGAVCYASRLCGVAWTACDCTEHRGHLSCVEFRCHQVMGIFQLHLDLMGPCGSLLIEIHWCGTALNKILPARPRTWKQAAPSLGRGGN